MSHPRLLRLVTLLSVLVVLVALAAPAARAVGSPKAEVFASRVVVLPVVRGFEPPPAEPQLNVWLRATPSSGVTPGEVLTIQINVENTGNAANGRFNVYLPYNRNQLEVIGSDTSAANGDWVSSVTNNWVTVTFGRVNAGSGRVAYVYFRVNPAAAIGSLVQMRGEYDCPGGCRTNTVRVEVRSDNSQPGDQITLAVVPDRGLPGTCHVFSTDQFRPRERVTTWLNTPTGVQSLTLSGTTDAVGAISLTFCSNGLAFGDYSLVAFGAQSRITGVGAFRVQGTSDFTVPPPVSRAVPPPARADNALDAQGGISGRVTAQNGEPLEGVLVLVRDAAGEVVTSETTDADGRYAVYYGLASGQYRVEFEPALALSRSAVVLAPGFASPDPVTVVAPNITSGVNGVLVPGGSISGRVTAQESGAPLAGVLVLVRDGTGVVVASADTEADGSYTVRGLPSGAYQVLFEPTAAESRVVRAYADQAYNSGATVSVTAPATVTGVDAALQRRAAAGQVFGTVTGANTGAPLEGVPVVVRNLAGVVLAVVYTDAQGAYSTGDLPAGIYRATFLPQFSPLAATSTYAPQDSAPVDVPLGRPARIDAVLAPRS
jgi:hypothetical protein